MASKSIEDGIRSYLDSVGTSSKPTVDREAVKALRSQIRQEADSINRLRLMAQLETEQAGRTPDSEGSKAVFIAEAKNWAQSEGIAGKLFAAMGVPDEVLTEAGFEASDLSSSLSPNGRSSRSTGSSTRAPRIPFEGVVGAAHKLGSSWKLTDLAAALDRDPGTARNYINRLLSENVVTVVGDDPDHDGRGRAPKLYSAK